MSLNPDQQVLLIAVARSWIGTPFDKGQAVRGVGVDCVRLAAEIYLRLGVISEFDPPPYHLDGGNHLDRSQVLEYLQAHGDFHPVPGWWSQRPAEQWDVLPGDLLVMKIGRVEHHVGVVIDPPRFVHALASHGVIESTFMDPTYRSRVTAVYRPNVSAKPNPNTTPL